MFERIKNKILDLMNYCYCPFVPDDMPFPQSCDKRTIHTDYCKNECPWRKDFKREKSFKNPIARNEQRKIYMCKCGNTRITAMDNCCCICGRAFLWEKDTP